MISNLWAAHHDTDKWTDPKEFDPYRHIGEGGRFIKSKCIIPYGVGPRNCLGESVARMEIFMFFVAVMQKFEAQPSHDGEELSLVNNGGLLNSPKDHDIVMTERWKEIVFFLQWPHVGLFSMWSR